MVSGPGRAGSLALSIFTRVLRAEVLRAHAGGPLSSGELEERLGWAAAASLRVATAELCELGAVRRGERPATVTELTVAGRVLLELAGALERWLSDSPFAPLDLSDAAARGVVRALVAGWDSTVVRSLAARSRSLAELSQEISIYSYPALKRRFAKLRSATLVARADDRGRVSKYEPTVLLRRAVRPLSLAARWERDYASATHPIDGPDFEAALLLALPLVQLPADSSGSCVLAAPAAGRELVEGEQALAAVSLIVEGGRIATLRSGRDSTPLSWAMGSTDAWLDTIVEGRLDGLRMGGADTGLATTVAAALHNASR